MVYSSFLKSFYLALLIATSIFAFDGYNQSGEHASKWHALTNGDGLTNPALLSKNERLTATLSLSPSKESNYMLQRSELIFPFKAQTIGVQFLSGKALDPENVNVLPHNSDSILATYTDFEHGEYTIGLTYAVQPGMKRVSMGTAIKYFQYDHLRDGKQQGASLDIGVDVKVLDMDRIGTHSLGIRAVNLLSYNTVKEDISDLVMQLGATYTGSILDKRLSLLFDAAVDSINTEADAFTATQNIDGSFDIKEGAKSVGFTFLSKVGYQFNSFSSANLGIGNSYFTLGAGLNLAPLRREKDLALTYNFNKFFVDDKEYSHTLAMRVELLKNRREE